MAAKKSRAATTVADALLEAHVRHVIDELTGPGFMGRVAVLLDAGLADAKALTLNDVVTRDMIKGVARAYAIELDLGPGIPELVGDVARALHAHPIHDATKLSDLVPDRRFDDLLDHALALKSVRRRLVEEVIASPLYESFASDLLLNGIRDYLARGAMSGVIPGARSAMKLGKAMVSRARPGLEDVVEEQLRRYIGKSVASVSQKSAQPLIDGEHDAALREVALDSWQRIRSSTIGSLREDLSSLELEELFVTLYEWWKEMRHAPFVGAMIDAGIDGFFDKYGDLPLPDLLEDIGITRGMLLREAERFAPPVIRVLHEQGLLERSVRREFEEFYRSGAVEAVLAKHG